MKRFLALCSVAVIAATFCVSVLGGQAKAVSNGRDSFQQYGAISLWNYDQNGVFRHRCTASLINRYWALTAAHCNYPSGPNPPVLIVGQTSVRALSLNNTSGYQDLGLAKVIVHPDYQPDPDGDGPELNDIALIKFNHPVNDSKQLLELPSVSPAIGAQGPVAGWGWICDDTVGTPGAQPNCGLPYPTRLQQTSLEVVQDSRCEWFSDPSTQFCTVGAQGKHTMACRGDSGGPLVRKSFSGFTLMGIVVGDGDYEINHPNECDENINGEQGTGLFTDVAPYRQWIISAMYGLN